MSILAIKRSRTYWNICRKKKSLLLNLMHCTAKREVQCLVDWEEHLVSFKAAIEDQWINYEKVL
jgi:hypothetical protein